jgi:hypothetical protein
MRQLLKRAGLSVLGGVHIQFTLFQTGGVGSSIVSLWLQGLIFRVFHPRVQGDPVYFPGLAPVVREGLLKTARIGSNVRDNKSNNDGSAIKCFLGEKLAAPIFEAPDHGWAHGTTVAAGKVEAPLPGLGIV